MANLKKQGLQDSAIQANRDPRKYRRVSCLKMVFFRCRHRQYRGMLINISHGGVFIETKNKFLFGQAVELMIPNFKQNKGLTIKGWVVRLGPTGVGVTFRRVLERRSGKERRSDLDRRSGLDRRARRKQSAEV